ncbi:hypothetical protein M408DRAFT_325911 [Serendipita vermifera MAFF 305830]|uniref:Uncharacterized protein n=1 Tax=Serendipita vermifera MAFF 305830 TaxID=933852 RepID=A0A0C2Y0B0_SERVB|nr:hypothetical protein M408DRAFT_325911 [Serendipita vermifera MAFF 305830]
MSSPKNNQDFPSSTDLDPVLAGLNASIERAMVSLYSIEVATINANGENPPHQVKRFTEIRHALKEQWEAILGLVRKCHSFGADVGLLRTAVANESKEDIREFLKEMVSKCDQCITEAKALEQGHSGVLSAYKTHRNEFKGQLDHPKVVIDVVSLRNAYTDTEPHRGGSSNWHGGEHELVADSFKSLYPDGKQAINDFETSTHGIYQQLQTLRRFLEAQSHICSQCLAELDKPKPSLNFHNLASQWAVYQTIIMESITSIAKVCDAILVQAVAPPPPKRVQALEYNQRGEGQTSNLNGDSHEGVEAKDSWNCLPHILSFFGYRKP